MVKSVMYNFFVCFRQKVEMENLSRRMDEIKVQHAQDKENYRVQLVETLLAAKKNQVQLNPVL